MTTGKIRLVTVAMSLMAGLAACSSDGDEKKATPPAAAPTKSAAGATGSVTASASVTASISPAAETSAPAPEPTGESPSTVASTTAAGAPAGGDTCDLLTDAEVATALDEKVVKAVFSVQPLGANQCVWANDTVPVKTYSLSITRTQDLPVAMRDAGQSATTFYEASKNIFPGAQPLPGYGDDATIAESTIMARKGDVFISATTFFGTSAEAVAALKSLTLTAIGKL